MNQKPMLTCDDSFAGQVALIGSRTYLRRQGRYALRQEMCGIQD